MGCLLIPSGGSTIYKLANCGSLLCGSDCGQSVQKMMPNTGPTPSQLSLLLAPLMLCVLFCARCCSATRAAPSSIL